MEQSDIKQKVFYDYCKRLIDIIASSISIIMFSPMFLVMMIIIKIEDGGPVFVLQTRIGKRGEAFYFIKFRTMRLVAEIVKNDSENETFDDEMFTPIGRFLRKMVLDELPCLFNVLKGDVSLVGPRPVLPYVFEKLNEWQKQRNFVRPGLTGLWQISSNKKNNLEDLINMDLEYVRRRSLLLDLSILLKTIPIVLFGK